MPERRDLIVGKYDLGSVKQFVFEQNAKFFTKKWHK